MKLMGVVNVTPNSSSDGGLTFSEEKALERVCTLLDHGVEIIDVGAEATNQYAEPITLEEEKRRLASVFPKIVHLAHKAGALVSIDTYKPKIAEMCIDAGVDIINDMNGLKDPKMLELVNSSGKVAIVSHSITIPARFENTLPAEANAVEEVCSWMEEIADLVTEKNQLILDPGIGFGKKPQHDWSLVKNASALKRKAHSLGAQLCMGHSRKSFMGSIDRECGTLALSTLFWMGGVDVIRVHNTLLHRWFFESLEAAC